MAPQRPTGLIGQISPRPGAVFRAARAICAFLARALFGLRMELLGAEHLPRDEQGRLRGGWVAVPTPHRRWIDPFLLLILLPAQPRIVFFGDGRVLFRTRFRRWLFRTLGGVVPVWPRGGAKAFVAHIQAAREVVEAGAIFVIFPEAGPAVPVPGARRIEPGFGYLAMRAAAPLVPLVIAGTDELYRGRRLTLRVLPATTAGALAGLAPDDPVPTPASSDERQAARRIADAFAERIAPLIQAAHEDIVRRSAGDRRRWPWLTHWLDWDADAADAAARRERQASGSGTP